MRRLVSDTSLDNVSTTDRKQNPGEFPVRRALAVFHPTRHGFGCSPEQGSVEVLATDGADKALDEGMCVATVNSSPVRAGEEIFLVLTDLREKDAIQCLNGRNKLAYGGLGGEVAAPDEDGIAKYAMDFEDFDLTLRAKEKGIRNHR
jgi:hypothetical protein